MIRKFRIILFIFLVIGLVCTAKSFFLLSANAQNLSSDASDAIAVRIIPNPNHYSIARWYESQGFAGAPQALTVDGYEAIRDGRTVYVNATNIAGKNIYTNVYLISYNQSSAAMTVDILGQIVSHWKFNSNVDSLESTNPVPSCSISNQNCAADSDCSADETCSKFGTSLGSCILKNPKNCLIDSECPTNFFCDSLKAKIIRDAKRIGQLEELKEALYKYKLINSHFPTLSAGTYLANHSVSVWPSWSQNLIANLTTSANFLDPINRLGVCPSGYDIKTCWNSALNRFVFSPIQNRLTLPAQSYVYVYQTDVNGTNYNVCTNFESRVASLDYHFAPNDPVDLVCSNDTGVVKSNTAPVLVSESLNGEAGSVFNGFIKVSDAENDPLTWTLYTSGTVWKNWYSNGIVNAAPVLKDTSDPNQKNVYASLAGEPRTYDIGLKVEDGQGGILNTTTVITITNSAPVIQADNIDYNLSAYTPFSYSFIFSDNNLDNPAADFSVTKLSGPTDFWPDLKIYFTQVSANTYKVSYSGIIPSSYKFLQNTDFIYEIKVIDKYKAVSTENVNIRFIVDKPLIDFNCLAKTRIGKDYSCVLGSAVSSSRQNITYSSLIPLFNNLVITKSSSSVFSIVGTAAGLSSIDTNILATDDYGATSSKAFSLKSNNYCGDGKVQLPNSEGQGGPYNNGYEDCDGADGVTNVVASSSISKQYACSTKLGDLTPDTLTSNSYCSFISASAGGGYCGDGYCSALDSSGAPLETPCNCPQDCGTPVGCSTPPVNLCGNGIIDPGEDCDGSNVDNKFCMSIALSPPGFTCDSNCKFNTTDCTPDAHGNGYYLSETDNKSYSCQPGTFGVYSTNAYDTCLPCPAGTFSAGLGNYKCTPCQTGYYSLPGATSCSPVTATCPSGKYASGATCLDCPAGYYCVGGYGRAACPFGYTGPAGSDSKTKCTPCPANTYATSGSSTCTPCPTGYVSSPGQSVCIRLACRSGYYLSGSSCNICPAGNYCTGCFGSGNNTWAYYDNCVSLISPCPAGTTAPSGSISSMDCR